MMKTELDKRVAEGWIKAIPNGHLTLYSYTQKCVYDRHWDEYTMAARGLILNAKGDVVARPWSKFFNLGETPDVPLPDGIPELSNKYDGSLVIVFHDKAERRWRAVTRGCWKNEQTEYANKWLVENDHILNPARTFLFELVAPWNRIVVHYKKADMILIGIVDNATGFDRPYAVVRQYALQRGLSPVEFQSRPIESVNLEDPDIENEEGFVARFPNGYRVKLKYRQYVLLHKIVTGLSIKGIWEILKSGNEPDLSNVPDEFMDWYVEQTNKIKGKFDAFMTQAKGLFALNSNLYKTRKEYAAEFVQHKPLTGALFTMLDGKDPAPGIWKLCKPEQHEVFKVDCTE